MQELVIRSGFRKRKGVNWSTHQRLSNVQNNENQITSSSDCNDLFTPTLTILSSLNNSRKIQDLNFGSMHIEGSRYGRYWEKDLRERSSGSETTPDRNWVEENSQVVNSYAAASEVVPVSPDILEEDWKKHTREGEWSQNEIPWAGSRLSIRCLLTT